MTKILAISGSLRAESSNTRLLQRIASIASADAMIELWGGLSAVPAFNPDLADSAPGGVTGLRAAVARSQGVIISSPEYAHGIAGAFKNALDWLVGSGEFYEKPVVLINASPTATIAQAALAETLRTMGARIAGNPRIRMPAGDSDEETDARLHEAISALRMAIDPTERTA